MSSIYLKWISKKGETKFPLILVEVMTSICAADAKSSKKEDRIHSCGRYGKHAAKDGTKVQKTHTLPKQNLSHKKSRICFVPYSGKTGYNEICLTRNAEYFW